MKRTIKFLLKTRSDTGIDWKHAKKIVSEEVVFGGEDTNTTPDGVMFSKALMDHEEDMIKRYTKIEITEIL